MRRFVFRWLFGKLAPFSWIDGNKTEIARLAAYVSAALLLLGEFYPEVASVVELVNAQLLLVLSLVGVEIGKQHREDKEEDELEELAERVAEAEELDSE